MSSLPFEDHTDFAKTDDEAARRFEIARNIDPFPEIQPSLLNSADISDYVRMTGMLHPFDTKKLKPASYEAAIQGRCIWWDDSGKLCEVWLEKERDEEFTLAPNSITFVQVEPLFRLPDYIALRFNLKITNVHRGILLGTGPLVDPGFVGRLLIPIHNLTPNTYRFGRGEGLIWVEFTKTSELPTPARANKNHLGVSRQGKYTSFPKNKWNIQPLDYLRKASPQSPVGSSIPKAVLESRNLAESAKRTVTLLTGFGVAGILALGLTTWQLIQDVWKVADDVRYQLTQEADGNHTKKIEELEKQLRLIDTRTTEKITTLEKQVDQVKLDTRLTSGRPAAAKPQDEQGKQTK